MATKSKKINPKTADTLKVKASEINKNLLKFADAMVDETIATGEQWQNLFSKTLKQGTTLLGKQQDILFTGLEKIRDQYTAGNKRFKSLISQKPIDAIKPVTPTPKTSVATKTKTVKKAVAKKTTTVSAVDKNDFKLIEGIGPKIEELLNKAGIQNFNQLKSASVSELKKILEEAGARYRMHDPSSWNDQAALAAENKMDELKALQAKLKGGK